MKRKLVSIMLVLSIALSFMPFCTVDASAASTGAKTLLKTKTVQIKPGKTYKSPKISLSEKMAFQVPIEVWLSPKDKGKPKSYIKKGGFKISLKTSKGKTMGTVSGSLKGVDKREDYWYSNWMYYYAGDDMSEPGYPKGKYYFTIKNTTNRIIKVKYSVKGYTEIASTADFPEEIDWREGVYWSDAKIGIIGPGIPLIESVDFDDPLFTVDMWNVDSDGNFSLLPMGDFLENETKTATLSVKLRNREEPYKIKMTIKGDLEVDDEEDEDYYDDED